MSAIVAAPAPPSAALLGLLALLQERTGLEMPASRLRTCETPIGRAMVNAGVRDLHHLRAVLDRDPVAFDALVDELTIGETYFFRDPRQFAFLRTVAIPDIVRRRGPGHVVSAWSAGCASGEEPYSLAIMLHELGLGDRRRILGTDLSRRRLDTARRGRYGKWSLRGVPPAVVDRYFQRDGATFELTPSIRSAVRFQYLNLAEDIASETSPGGFDLIVCRNVLIYFDSATIGRVLGQMVDRLACGGWLLLGPSDPPLPNSRSCDVVMTDAGLAYRRRARGLGAAEPAALPATASWRPAIVRAPATQAVILPPALLAPAPRFAGETTRSVEDRPVEPTPVVDVSAPRREATWQAPEPDGGVELLALLGIARQLYADRDYEQAAAQSKRYLHGGGRDGEGYILLVRSLANTGRANAAALACAAGLGSHALSAELTVLHALLLTELERHDAAVIAARRALYLDCELIVAHVALGNALVRSGDAAAARRTFGNATRLLAPLAPTFVVPASDGTPAAHLAAIVRGQLQRLAKSAT